MIIARMCETGDDVGKWYSVILERKGVRRAGYCATGCSGHDSPQSALAHYLQFESKVNHGRPQAKGSATHSQSTAHDWLNE